VVRTVIIDDHPLVRSGVQQALDRADELRVVASAGSVDQALAAIARTRPDLAIVDLRLPGGGGLKLIRQARNQVPDCRFVIFSSFASSSDVAEALALEVDGYVLKESLPEELIMALRLVLEGRRYYAPEILKVAVNLKEEPLDQLTPRETEVLHLLAKGLSNKEIADKLFVSENTVKTHVSRILGKLGMEHRTEAALYAVSKGIESPRSSGCA